MRQAVWGMAILLWSGIALGAASVNFNPLPSAMIFPSPVGILFPGFNVAAGVNPAALPLPGKANSVQLAYTPSLRRGDDSSVFAGAAIAKKGLGVGLGYQRTQTSSTKIQGIFGGVGFAMDSMSFGLGLRDSQVDGGFSPNVDIGFIVGNQKNGKGVSFGGVFYNLDHYPQMALGIGYGNVKRYNLEANILMPPFDYLGTGYYIFTLSATLRAEFLSLYFRSSYPTRTDNFTHTLGIAAQVMQNLNVFAQFTPSRTLTFGASAIW